MRLALREGQLAGERGEVPVGCVVVHEGEVIGSGGNERELRPDPTAHAEILALRAAAQSLGGWRLPSAVLYVTLEPCPMCAGAIRQSRIARVIYGAPDPKQGAAGSVLDVLGDGRLPNRVETIGGILAEDALALLGNFFGDRR